MLCYKDMTFCKFYMACMHGGTCHRAYTPKVAQAAREWWGNDEVPVAFFMLIPDCWERLVIGDPPEIFGGSADRPETMEEKINRRFGYLLPDRSVNND
jgi:hypothetical protein